MRNPDKKHYALGLAACGLTGVYAIAGAQAAPTMQKFTDAAHHYSVEVPAAWKHERHDDQDSFIGPVKKKLAANIGLLSASAGPVSQEQVFKIDLAVARRGLAQLKGATVTPTPMTTMGGKPAQTMLLHIMSDGLSVEQRRFVCLHDQIYTAMSISYPAGQWTKYSPLIDRIRGSFKWEK